MDNKEDYFNTKDFREFLDRYERSLGLGKDEYFESQELTDIAEYYYSHGKLKEAIAALDYAIRLHPGSALPLVFRGRMALIDEKNADLACKYVGQISDQTDLDCIYLKAEIMIAGDEVEEADRFLQDSMDVVDEDDLPDYVLDVATLFVDYGQPDKATQWLERSDEPDLADYRELKARIAYTKGDYGQSEEIFEKLIDDDPYSAKYWNSLAASQFMDNRINDAITSSEYSIAINPDDFEAVLNKANGLFSLGNFAEAIKYYKRYSELIPFEDGGAMLFIGNCMLNMGKPEEALPYYKKAAGILEKEGMGTTEVFQCMAFTYSQLDLVDDALSCIDKVIKEQKDNKDAMVVKGHILLEHGRSKEAIATFMEVLHSSSYSPEVFFRIAMSVFDCGYPSVAYRMFRTYEYNYSDNDHLALAYLAACCKRMKRRDKYLEFLRKACEMCPHEVRKVLGVYFPEGMDPKDYYDYEISKENK